MASTPGPAMESLGRVAYELYHMKPLVPTYIHLLVSAIFPIYTAAHASLARPPSAAPARKKDANVNDLQDEEISPTIEALTASDALLFPVLAGVTLASLYFILKWLQDPALLNYYLGLYFGVVGLWFTVKFVRDGITTVRSYTLPNQYSYKGKLWKLVADERRFVSVDGQTDEQRMSPLPGRFSILFQSRNKTIWAFREVIYTRFRLKFSIWKLVNILTVIDTSDLIAVVIATPLVYYHTFVDKPWFLTNILGFSFCYGSLQVTTPGTSSTGSLLLAALFLYDIYFVFYTPMMVTVATKLDVPIKLLFPRPDGCIKPANAEPGSEAMEDYLQCLAKKRTMAMLGLGDIVIPGMMLAFALRFDLYLYYLKKSGTTVNQNNDNDKIVSDKPTYLPATGSWGERFWTTTTLHTSELQAKRFPKVYFTASTVGYILGMIATVVVMQVYQHAQPALLYLVPGVLGSLWSVALVKGDFKALWNYSEVPEELKSDDKKDEKEKSDKNGDRKAVQDAQDDKTKAENNAADPANSASQNENPTSNKQIDSTATSEKSNTSPEQAQDGKEISNPEQSKSKDKDKEDYLVYFALTLINSKTKQQSGSDQPTEQKRLSSSLDTSIPVIKHSTPIKPSSGHSPSTESGSEEWSSEGDDSTDADADADADGDADEGADHNNAQDTHPHAGKPGKDSKAETRPESRRTSARLARLTQKPAQV